MGRCGMESRPRHGVRDHDTLVRHHIGPDESVSEAVLLAFERLDDDLGGRETPLYDWIDLDAVEMLFRNTGTDPRVVVTIWDHPVVLAPGFVEILPRD